MKLKLITVLLLISTTLFAQVAINTDGSTPDDSAILDLKATNAGLLIPRVALTGTDDSSTINTPATSLMVYNTATAGAGATAITPGFYYYDGSNWIEFLSGSSADDDWVISGNDMYSAVSGKVGIGTSSIDAKFDVLSTSEQMRIKYDANNFASFSVNDAGVLTIDPTANEMRFGVYDTGLSANAHSLKQFSFTTVSSFVFQTSSNGYLQLMPGGNGDTSIRVDDDSDFDVGPLFVDGSSNNVGIGVTTPETILHVARDHSDGDADPIFHTAATNVSSKSNLILRRSRGTVASPDAVQNNDMIGAYDFQAYDGSSYLWSGNMTCRVDGAVSAGVVPTSLTFYVIDPSGNNNKSMIIKSTGDVGIGTDTPSEKLEVNGNILTQDIAVNGGDITTDQAMFNITQSVDGEMRHYINGELIGSFFNSGLIVGGQATGNPQLYTGTGTATEPVFTFMNDTDTGIYRGGDDIVYFSTDGTNRMSIIANGNVGIGIDNPATQLEVRGTSAKIRASYDGSNYTELGSDGATAYFDVVGAGNQFDIRFDNTANFTVLDGGNVGVGTTTPNEALEVNGSIRMTDGNQAAGKVMVSDANGTASWGDATGRVYEIGDFAQGGIVFWVDATGEHGLVCTKSDQSTGIRWYAGTNGSTQAKGDGPYAGRANTNIVIAAQVAIGDDGSTYAARVCNELEITEASKTYGDWYLPSQKELDEMYQNKAAINATASVNSGSDLASANYWGSNESSASNASSYDMGAGSNGNQAKSTSNHVRAVRSF